MASYNHHCLGILNIVYFGIFIIVILISIWLINYDQEQIFILRGVLDEIDEILSELPGDEGVRIILLLPHGRLVYGHSYPITYFFHSILIGSIL